MPSNSHFDVIILGAGASGLLCAFTAAQRGRRVLVLERSNKVGKKILMSGGGRCNFTNQFVGAENFISGNSHFCKAALSRYTQWDFIAMVERHGIDYEERKHSQLFCLHSAKDILAMLLRECDSAGVHIRERCDITSVSALPAGERGYLVSLPNENLICQSLVVATGGLSIPTLGGSGLGYDLARQFGMTVTPLQAGLVPFMFSDATKGLCERLSGLALEVEIRCHQQSFSENLLFTHRGMSGPAVLQISNYWAPGDSISIDLLPLTDAREWLLQEKRQSPKSLLRTVLQQKLAKALVIELQQLWWTPYKDAPLAELPDRLLGDVAHKLNQWQVKPSGSEGYRTAEVTRGGVDTAGVSSKTMEAKDHPGLYFIGEVLDVTGWLGGFNFQWAWSSGYSAGLAV